MCYREFGWIEKWMNNATVRAELVVDVRAGKTFANCDANISRDFFNSVSASAILCSCIMPLRRAN